MNSVNPWKAWLWWAYFCAGVVATLWGAFYLPAPISVVSIVSDIAGVVTLAAIFGYVTQRPLGSNRIWLFAAPMVIAIQAVFFIYTIIAPRPVLTMLLTIVVAAALFAPAIWALYAYAFRSPHVWRSVHA